MILLRPSDKFILFIHQYYPSLDSGVGRSDSFCAGMSVKSREMSQHLLTSQTHAYGPDIRRTKNNWYQRSETYRAKFNYANTLCCYKSTLDTLRVFCSNIKVTGGHNEHLHDNT